MISNNLALLSQNMKNKYIINKNNKNNKNNNVVNCTNPQTKIMKQLFKAKVAKSHENLFNFINDSLHS